MASEGKERARLLESSAQYVEGYLVNNFQRDGTTYDDNCPDKTIFFDIPPTNNQRFDPGYVVLKINDQFKNLPNVQMFRDKDKGIKNNHKTCKGKVQKRPF